MEEDKTGEGDDEEEELPELPSGLTGIEVIHICLVTVDLAGSSAVH